MSVVWDFATLFAGNPDAHGADHGECVREGPPWYEHLFGDTPIGVYPCWHEHAAPGVSLVDELICRWGCIDLDVRSEKHPAGDYEDQEQAHDAAADLVTALAALGIVGWPEVTRSHGRHVWVFATEPVPAATMRRALLVACDIARVKATEVNPKSETLPAGSLGNYVRLPYPLKHSMSRYVFDRFGDGTERDTFVHDALANRAEPAILEQAAALFKVPVAYTPPALPIADDTPLHQRIGPVARRILEDGPLEGSDRSATLVRLAGKCRNRGLSADETYTIVDEADQRWGKFSTRPDRETRLAEIVEQVYP